MWTQTILIWLIPGFVFVAMHVLRGGEGSSLGEDLTGGDPGIHPYITQGRVEPPSHTGEVGHGT
jgi:hypothetical protein